MDIRIEELIRDVIIHELELPQNYGKQDGKIIPSVYVYSPLVSLGNTDKMQVGIKSLGSHVIANNHYHRTVVKEGEEVYQDVKETVISDLIQIDITSRNETARQRRFEVVSALTSDYAKFMQEKHKCRLFEIPSYMLNTQRAEFGATNIYRYTITVTTQYQEQYIKEVNYYDKFHIQGQVDNDPVKIDIKIER